MFACEHDFLSPDMDFHRGGGLQEVVVPGICSAPVHHQLPGRVPVVPHADPGILRLPCPSVPPRRVLNRDLIKQVRVRTEVV